MKDTRLTQEQIESLFSFCSKKAVKEYEIQVELVDHLASSIEMQLKQNTSLSFFDALVIAYNNFGTNGFKEIVKTKKRMFRRKYNFLFLKFLGTFFQLPRIILTAALTMLLFTLFRYFNESQIILEITACLAVSLNLLYMVLTLTYQKEERKSFIILQYFSHLRISTGLILNGLFVLAMHSGKHFNAPNATWLDFLLSFIIVFVLIITYSLMIYMPKLLKKHFKEQFPNILYSVL